jgi:hypothetical protein
MTVLLYGAMVPGARVWFAVPLLGGKDGSEHNSLSRIKRPKVKEDLALGLKIVSPMLPG